MVIIQFTDSTNLNDAMTDLRDKVSQVKSQLPDDASDPTVMSIDIDSMPVVSVALRGNDLASLQSIAEDEIQPALERLDGVASVDVSGGYEDEVAVKTNAARLKGYNLTITVGRTAARRGQHGHPGRRPRQRFADACRPHGRRVFVH